MKKLIFLVLSVLICSTAFAQSTVTGRVTSATDDLPIPFASVVVKGSLNGVSANENGEFELTNVPKGAVLQFSSIGYVTLDIPVNGRTSVNAVLSPDAESLNETIVVAYGTSKKGTFTGAASVVKSEALKDVPSVSFEQALNGKVAGMQITQSSGQAGSGSEIRIRGIGSMNASNEPLYVIDGVPAISGGTGQMGDYIYTSNSVMSTINSSDIESITVLKDAAASALYGSRAANGVILVTTKRG
ncbi:MAG: TonB-dependent receptor plug domain-containing protein, partial [Bacteroidales bacterium]|nr:TonB-dependent receptor plug domain-containing protein [Bacteroidales bacterium]